MKRAELIEKLLREADQMHSDSGRLIWLSLNKPESTQRALAEIAGRVGLVEYSLKEAAKQLSEQ